MTTRELRRILRALQRLQLDMERYADQLEDQFQAAMRRAQAQGYGRIRSLMDDAPNFGGLDHTQRLQWWVQHQAAIDEALAHSGYSNAVDGYLQGLPKFTSFVNQMMVSQGQAFLEFPKSTIDILRDNTRSKFIGLGARASQQITEVVYDEVLSGRAKSGALETIRGAITGEYPWGTKKGRYEWHATTYARTAHFRFARQLSANQAEELKADEHFLYLGPIDAKTRAFCVNLLGTPRTYTKAEITAMSNGQGPDVADVMIHGGGWNCRHNWLAVTPGLAKALKTKAGQEVAKQEAEAAVPTPEGVPVFDDADIADWDAAKTVKEAEGWAVARDLAGHVSYADLDLSAAHAINRHMAVLRRAFPKTKVGYLGSSSTLNRWLRENGHRLVDIDALTAPGLFWQHKPYFIAFSPDSWGSPTQIAARVAAHGRMAADGILSPLVAPGIRRTIHHEFGHTLDAFAGLSNNPEYRAIVAKFRGRIRQELAEYSAGDPREIPSEAFSEYMLADSPRELATSIGRLIFKLYNVQAPR